MARFESGSKAAAVAYTEPQAVPGEVVLALTVHQAQRLYRALDYLYNRHWRDQNMPGISDWDSIDASYTEGVLEAALRSLGKSPLDRSDSYDMLG